MTRGQLGQIAGVYGIRSCKASRVTAGTKATYTWTQMYHRCTDYRVRRSHSPIDTVYLRVLVTFKYNGPYDVATQSLS